MKTIDEALNHAHNHYLVVSNSDAKFNAYWNLALAAVLILKELLDHSIVEVHTNK